MDIQEKIEPQLMEEMLAQLQLLQRDSFEVKQDTWDNGLYMLSSKKVSLLDGEIG